MRRRLVLLLVSLAPVTVWAQSTDAVDRAQTSKSRHAPAESRLLRAGVAGEPPNVIASQAGPPSGLIVQYWNELATTAGLQYELILYPSTEEGLAALAGGNLDLLLGDVSITAERTARFDFTQPIAVARMTLLLPRSPPTLWGTLQPFLGRVFLSSVGGILLCLFAVGNLLWLAERRRNPENFPRAYRKGVREGMWCALTTFATVGYGDRVPVTHLGRAVAGVWMLISLVAVTSLTAGIATTLALAFSRQPSQEFRRPKDLAGARIAAVGHESAPVRWATFYRARVSEAETLPKAIALLEQGRVDGVLYPRPLLEYYLREHPQAPYQLANFDIGSEYLGIALPRGSALTQELNAILLQVDQRIRFEEMLRDWNLFRSKPASRQSPLSALPSGETH